MKTINTSPPLAPRNAYEQAKLLFAEIKQEAVEFDGDLIAEKLDELWRLFELCIPDADKPRPE